MTLLGSEHSLLIRSKFRSVLQLRLQQRRNRQHLVDHGLMSPLKSPAAFQEQRKNLERAKSEEYLKHKVRSRPERSDLIDMHILQDPADEGPAQTSQMKLKRARLADDLNERIALRPGPLELVEKNIFPLESTVKEAMKGSPVTYSKPVDAFAFEEDSSNDAMSPEQERGDDPHGISSSSPQESKNVDTTGSPHSAPTQNLTPENENDGQDVSAFQSHQCSHHSDNQLSPSGPVAPISTAVKNKPSADNKNRHKKPKDIKPKVKKLKYHQYIPPDQKAEKSPPPMDSAYARLLQQQQLFLQLQILSQQQQQHFNYQGMHHSHLKQPNDQMTRNANTPTIHSPSLSPVKTTFSGQANVSSMKPGLLPSNLDDLKVSELRQQLRIRGLPVSGTKTSLMERLRPFQECSNNSVPTFGEITTVTFPVTPNNSMSNYQAHSSSGVISNGFYQFGSTSSTPPISPASSDLSVNGSLPDTFSDGPMSSPQFGLHPSPIHLSAEESLMSSINSGSYQAELEGIDAEKDKMLVEKQKVINELTWKLQQEQRQVEELRLQLQKRKGSCGTQDKGLPSHHFFGVPIKQENVSSCPFASKQMSMKAQNNNTEKLGPCTTQSMSCLLNNHCMETSNSNSIMSSTFLSPQCSPQHSPLGTTNSPQHISLPPSPNNHYLLPVSPNTQGEARSVSPHINHRIHTVQNSGSPVCFSANQNAVQTSYMEQSENKQSNKEGVPTKSPTVIGKITAIQPTAQTGQKLATPGTTFSDATSSVSKQLPSYEDAVRQQITRSQQMDELLDVLIESGEMPANAKDERPCGQKLSQLSASPGNTNSSSSNSHLRYDNCSSNDSHLEVLLNSHSPIGKPTEIPLLKIGNDDAQFDRVMNGFSGKVNEDILPSREILETSLSPMETQMSPSSAESTALQHLSFTESPWETMEWLDLTPPSSAAGLGSLTATGPNIFNTDFLDVTDLNLNNAMDLHLEQW